MISKGVLFYVVGGSGSGKDAILKDFRENYLSRAPLHKPILIAHRYVTRPNSLDSNSIYLHADEFLLRAKQGLFCMHWSANQFQYGIGMEVDTWLTSGCHVIVNGSREYLSVAKEKYGSYLHSISIDVPTAILQQRLLLRRRENEEDIIARLERHQRLSATIKTMSTIDNSSTLTIATESFATTILEQL